MTDRSASYDSLLAMNAIQISELIGAIYETADDELLWPHLLERVASYLQVPQETGAANSAQTLLACLAPHFARAQDLNRQMREAENELESSHDLLNRLPMGLAMIDRE